MKIRCSAQIIVTSTFLMSVVAYGQLPDTFDLVTVRELALTQSLGVYAAQRDLSVATNDYNWFKASLQPSIAAEGQFPNFTRSSGPVIQPDGKINFEPIRYDNSTLSLSATQVIPWTGGSVTLTSNYQRFQDIENKQVNFNAIPLRLGISQSLFGFNPFKWDTKIEPLRLEEAQRYFNADVESALASSLSAFFQVLIQRKAYQSAHFILTNAREILTIAQERFALGKLSKNDLLQLQLNEKNAHNVVSSSQRRFIGALAILYESLNLPYDGSLKYPLEPSLLQVREIDPKKALQLAEAQRPEILQFRRVLLERHRALDQAKKENNVELSVDASFGLFKSDQRFPRLFRDLQQEQLLALRFSIPLVNGNRRKIRMAIADQDLRYSEQEVQSSTTSLHSDLLTEVALFQKLVVELSNTQEINAIALERFQISKESFLLGSISVTELFISQREQDDAARSYIETLRDYWNSYYRIRSMTLYDFENDRPLIY